MQRTQRTTLTIVVMTYLIMFSGWGEFSGRVEAQNLFEETFRLASEQRQIQTRTPEQIGSNRVPATTIPFTVKNAVARGEVRQEEPLSLDEVIQIAIRNAEVIRVVGGISANSTGRTIYDVARSNTDIDNSLAVFDPLLDITSTMNKNDSPGAIFDPVDPTRSLIIGSSSDSINTSMGLSKRNYSGTQVGLNVTAIGSYFEPGVVPLEPEYRSTAELTFRQPLARGYGRQANLAPVLIAKISTERSYFQFKDSVQELVRSTIAAYWNLVSARVNVWAREQQIEQAKFAYERALARKDGGLANVADVAQAKSALAGFRSSLITAQANLILTETALRNVLGIPPSNSTVIVPTSTPVLDEIQFNWDEIVTIASTYRPDIIELKLILEADNHALFQANNNARPQLDAIANYRWNGLSGEMPGGAFLASEAGRFAGFNLGVGFTVPIGLRQSRAQLRRQELIIASDRANLDQAYHQMVHDLTINYRNLDQFSAQYEASKEVREASRLNFEYQIGEYLSGRREFINVLSAITDWGNAVSQEAQAITQYNSELANVERQTGTILETHGIRFMEERYGSIGPTLLGRRLGNRCYPQALTINGSTDRYKEAQTNSDEAFNLEDLDYRRRPSDPSEQPEDYIAPPDTDAGEEDLLPPNLDAEGGATNIPKQFPSVRTAARKMTSGMPSKQTNQPRSSRRRSWR